MYEWLTEHHRRPPLFSSPTVEALWTDPHIAEQMLAFHLEPEGDLASRNHAFIRRSVAWLADRYGPSRGLRVLDLGCGPGLYANALAALGASVTGVDFSRNSLAYARSDAASRGWDATYRHGNYLEIDLEAVFDLVLLIFGDYCPLGPDQRRSLLERVKHWLAPEGRFVFDVSSAAYFEGLAESHSYEAAPEGGFWSPEPHFVFSKRFTYAPERAYLDRYLILEPARRREFRNWIQCYDPPSLEAELREAGWRVMEVFGNVAGDAYDPAEPFFAVEAKP